MVSNKSQREGDRNDIPVERLRIPPPAAVKATDLNHVTCLSIMFQCPVPAPGTCVCSTPPPARWPSAGITPKGPSGSTGSPTPRWPETPSPSLWVSALNWKQEPLKTPRLFQSSGWAVLKAKWTLEVSKQNPVRSGSFSFQIEKGSKPGTGVGSEQNHWIKWILR